MPDTSPDLWLLFAAGLVLLVLGWLRRPARFRDL
jgi:hypothetical protein